MQKKSKSYTFEEIKEKLANYCVYQDRCQWDVEKKMREFILIPEAKDEIYIYLIQNNFLNEERFVKSFVRGRFNQKKWGRNKIRMGLKQRKIPDQLIRIGLNEIDEEEYQKVLIELFDKKREELKFETNLFKRNSKIRNYLLQKGYENELIYDLLR